MGAVSKEGGVPGRRIGRGKVIYRGGGVYLERDFTDRDIIVGIGGNADCRAGHCAAGGRTSKADCGIGGVWGWRWRWWRWWWR